MRPRRLTWAVSDSMVSGVGKVMKRRLIKISAAILVAVGILLGLALQLVRDRGPEMSFGFLDGRTLTARIKKEPGRSSYRRIREVYSFEGNFIDICAKVDAELLAMGFMVSFAPPTETFGWRKYLLANAASAGTIFVTIRDRQYLKVYSTPKSSKYSSPDRHEYHHKNGWVTVEIIRMRLRSWPPQYFLIRLELMLRRNANNPPPKKS